MHFISDLVPWHNISCTVGTKYGIRCISQIFLRFSLISLAKFAVKVVNRILSLSPSLLARYFALCMATTVFPVPAPPRTLAGPEKFFWTTFRWDGCKIAFNRLLEIFCSAPSKINEQNQCDIKIQASQPCENFYK